MPGIIELHDVSLAEATVFASKSVSQIVMSSPMYVPPYKSLLRSIQSSKGSLASTKLVAIPIELLKLLLQFAVAQSDFDEEDYLRVNPDVREAVHRGQIESGRQHYVGYGYFEGRLGGMTKVDERWYLRKYPDVAVAVREGRVASAAEHFHLIGAGEGRSPSARQQKNAAKWKKAIIGE